MPEPLEIGCSTLTFGSFPVEEALDHVAASGLTAVDVAAVPLLAPHVDLDGDADAQAARLRELLDARGLRVEALISVPWVPDLVDDHAGLTRRSRVAASVAAAVGASVWIVDAGRPHPDGQRAGWDRLARTVAMQAGIAETAGVALAVEIPHRGTTAETWSDAVGALGALADAGLGADRVAVDFDTSHAEAAGHPIPAMIAEHGARVRHLAVRDRTTDGGFTSPGVGTVDFTAFVAAVRDAGLRLPLMLELEPPPETPVEGRLAEIAASVSHLRECGA